MKWKRVNESNPPLNENVLFLAEYNGELLHCFGHRVNEDRWHDYADTDRDGDFNPIFNVKFWMFLPPITKSELATLKKETKNEYE